MLGIRIQHSKIYGENADKPIVVLRESQPSVFVVLVRTRAGRIVGNLTDESSGKPVTGVVRLWLLDKPEIYVSLSIPSSFEILVPPSRVGVEIAVPGHDLWTSATDLKSKFVQVASGDEMKLDVQVRPRAKVN